MLRLVLLGVPLPESGRWRRAETGRSGPLERRSRHFGIQRVRSGMTGQSDNQSDEAEAAFRG
jgi:hypothetical protein